MATSLTRNNAAGTSARKGTLSVWIKFNDPICASGGHMIHQHYESGGNYFNLLRTVTDSNLQFHSTVGHSDKIKFVTNRKFRDISAWYHIVFAVDTTQATEANRVKIYINGVQETSFSTATYPTQNQDLKMNISGTVANINKNGDGAGMEHSCLMSHLHWIDGTQYAASDFGETDTTTGEWKIKTSPSVTYGTDGYFLFKDDNSANDQSGNGNNFTITGTLTKTEDNPSNVFATMNPLIPGQTNYTYSNGNTTITQGSAAWVKSNSTLGMTSGKYYWEAKYVSGSYAVVGVDKTDTATPYPPTSSTGIGYKSNGNVDVGTNPQTDIASYAHGDIVSIALDMDNGCVYFGKAGTWQNSGNPTSGSSKTGAYSLPSYVANTTYFTTLSVYSSATTSMNFGNGYFGTTAVSSAGTNASGNGIFEYDVPSGYTALSTKGLNL